MIVRTDDGMCMNTFYTEKHIIKIIIHISFVYVKHAANYVISFELYVDFNSQKIMKLSRQQSRPFGPGCM